MLGFSVFSALPATATWTRRSWTILSYRSSVTCWPIRAGRRMPIKRSGCRCRWSCAESSGVRPARRMDRRRRHRRPSAPDPWGRISGRNLSVPAATRLRYPIYLPHSFPDSFPDSFTDSFTDSLTDSAAIHFILGVLKGLKGRGRGEGSKKDSFRILSGFFSGFFSGLIGSVEVRREGFSWVSLEILSGFFWDSFRILLGFFSGWIRIFGSVEVRREGFSWVSLANLSGFFWDSRGSFEILGRFFEDSFRILSAFFF